MSNSIKKLLCHIGDYQFTKKLLNVVYPPKCICCKKDVSDIHCFCHECHGEIEFISEPYCSKCSVALPTSSFGNLCAWCIEHKRNFYQNKSVVRYDGPIKDLIHELKYNQKPAIAKTLAHIMHNRYRNYVTGAHLIAPIPMEEKKLTSRGYNQAHLIAKTISELSGTPLRTNLLKKHKVNFAQMELGRVDRYRNLKDAFEFTANRKDVYKRDILLIDDVMTTGATIDHCAKILKKNGARRVLALTFARTY